MTGLVILGAWFAFLVFAWCLCRASAMGDRELLDLLDERRARTSLYPTGDVQGCPQYPPVTYPDGTTDATSRALDVLADALASEAAQPGNGRAA